MTSHSELQLEIPTYVAGKLDADTQRRLEEHLATCQECRDLVASCESLAEAVHHEKDPDAAQ